MITAQQRPATKAPVISSTKSVVERMAEAMRDMRAAGQTVTAENLAVHGDFTDEQVKAYGVEAANLARSLNTRAVA